MAQSSAGQYTRTWQSCPISATTTLGAAGAIGDFLESVVIVVGTAATALVQIKDGSGTATDILPNSPGGGVGTYIIPLNLTSKLGAWQIITLAGSKCIAIGSFT